MKTLVTFLQLGYAISMMFSSGNSRLRRYPPTKSDIVETIKNDLLISDVIKNFLELKPTGPMTYICKCPFHDDTNPSMSVNDDKSFYYCFPCQTGGDAIKFVEQYESCSFIDAIDKISAMFSLETPESSNKVAIDQRYFFSFKRP